MESTPISRKAQRARLVIEGRQTVKFGSPMIGLSLMWGKFQNINQIASPGVRLGVEDLVIQVQAASAP